MLSKAVTEFNKVLVTSAVSLIPFLLPAPWTQLAQMIF